MFANFCTLVEDGTEANDCDTPTGPSCFFGFELPFRFLDHFEFFIAWVKLLAGFMQATGVAIGSLTRGNGTVSILALAGFRGLSLGKSRDVTSAHEKKYDPYEIT